ncbi:MAG: hypothetical protein AAF533_03160 [Acidobacteriota bacterium]
MSSAHLASWLAVGVVALAYLVLRRARVRPALAANLLTSLGILGTFVGVAWALLGLDPENVHDGLPVLLAGLRTAFLSSVAGLALAVLVRVEALWKERHRPAEPSLSSSVTRLSQELDEQAAAARLQREKQVELLRALRAGLAPEGSTLSQELASTQVEALRGTISDLVERFHQGLDERFGVDLRQLDEAVRELASWQRRATEQLDALRDSREDLVASLRASREQLEALTRTAGELGDATGRLSSLSGELGEKGQLLEEGLARIATLGREASESLPDLERSLSAVTTGLERAASEVMTSLEEGSGELRGAVRQCLDAMRDSLELGSSELRSTLQAGQVELREFLVAISQGLKESLEGGHAELGSRLSESATEFQGRLRQLHGEVSELLGQQLAELATRVDDLSTRLPEERESLAEIAKAQAEIAEELRQVVRLLGKTGDDAPPLRGMP